MTGKRYADWPGLVEKYGQKRSLTDNLKTAAAAVVNRPELERSPTKMNLQKPRSGTLKGSPSLGRTSPVQRTSSRIGNLEDAEVEDFQFIFRPTSVLPLVVEHSLIQPEAIHFLYVQGISLLYLFTSFSYLLSPPLNFSSPTLFYLVLSLSLSLANTHPAVHHVVNSNYPCLTQTAIILAGVQLQIQLGDQKSDHLEHIKYPFSFSSLPLFLVLILFFCFLNEQKLTISRDSLEHYIPEHLRDKRKQEEWVQDIFSAHQLHKGKDTLALKRAYLEVVQQWPFYGCTFFRVKYLFFLLFPSSSSLFCSPPCFCSLIVRTGVPSQTSFFKQEYQGTVVVGINHFGMSPPFPLSPISFLLFYSLLLLINFNILLSC